MAVADFSLEIADGELVAFLGPSGCGKTTTLRMIAGFLAPSAGTIRIGGQDVTDLPVHKRNTGMVFQRYALFPHMTVAQNVAFGLEMHKVPAAERDSRIREVLDMVRMADSLRDRYPRQLSGGQQQRWRSRRAGHPAQGVPAGRAAVQPGCQAAARRCARKSARCSSAWA